MTRITVKPTDGRLVRHPSSYQPLSPNGESVEKNSYWLRKLRAGDVIEINEAGDGQKKKGA